MALTRVQFTELPLLIKAAFALFTLHTLLYAAGMLETYFLGEKLYPVWFIHMAVCLYFLLVVIRRSEMSGYILAIYCFVFSVWPLWKAYLLALEHESVFYTIMFRSVAIHGPLFCAGICFLMGRSFYRGKAI